MFLRHILYFQWAKTMLRKALKISLLLVYDEYIYSIHTDEFEMNI